ncbi:hypothetical protein [Microvirga tunisiensis]|uniref:hypothetical protein n=1 Tax=Microvirga tunisiensis TaxID=2108360 RepID=UPI00128B3D37|nr:hypothetical protein [Microvirga tunisiensis]MPR10854.1 hypothetical protein [Microvirga tunisiensis]
MREVAERVDPASSPAALDPAAFQQAHAGSGDPCRRAGHAEQSNSDLGLRQTRTTDYESLNVVNDCHIVPLAYDSDGDCASRALRCPVRGG